MGILRTKIRLLLMIGVLLAVAAGCQFAGEYLHSHYIREEVSETSGNISEKKTVVIDSGHGGKDRSSMLFLLLGFLHQTGNIFISRHPTSLIVANPILCVNRKDCFSAIERKEFLSRLAK